MPQLAVGTLDERFFDSQKSLNLLKFENEKKTKTLQDLKKQNLMLMVDDDDDADEVVLLNSVKRKDAGLEVVSQPMFPMKSQFKKI